MNSLEKPSVLPETVSSDDEDDKDKKTKKKSTSIRLPFNFLDKEIKQPVKVDQPVFSLDKLETKDKAADQASETKEANPPPLEDLSPEEEQEAAQLLRAEARNIRSQAETSDPTEETVNQILDNYDQKIIEANTPPEVALRESLEEFGLEDTPIDQPAQEDSIDQAVDLRQPSQEGEFKLSPTAAEVFNLSLANENQPEQELSSGGDGGHNKPPIDNFSGDEDQPNPWRSSRFNNQVIPPQGLAAPKSYNHIRRDHSDYWSGFMDGGIIGYFVGHRRGRIKTERKLESVKKKLEKRIDKIDKKLQSHEQIIRQAVKKQTSENNKQKIEVKPVPKKLTPEKPTIERPAIKSEVLPAAEIHIGKLIMSERPKENSINTKPKPEQVFRKMETKQAKVISPETMTKAEVLKVSETIMVEGDSLKHIYDSHLIGEKGLRRLVAEYQAGKDLSQALKHEVTERQIDFERDPAMRDVSGSAEQLSSETSHQKLENRIKQAESALSTTQEQVAFLKAKASFETKTRLKQTKQVRAINAVLLSIIAGLIIAVLLLVLLKR